MSSWTNTTRLAGRLPPELPLPTTTTDVGALRPADGSGRPEVERLLPADGPDRYVDRYWTFRWDLARPSQRTVLTHPAVHVSVEVGEGMMHGRPLPATLVHGVVRGTFTVDLPVSGWVFGFKFRPGGFHAMTGIDASTLTDRVVDLATLLDGAAELGDGVMAAGDARGRADVADAWLAAFVPCSLDPEYVTVLGIVATMLADRSLIRAEDVAATAGLSIRSLQRLFKLYVGVGPKWLLARYRLHDAIAAIDSDRDIDLAVLAADLGWFDQAHFTRDFTALVGVSPLAYRARPG